MIERIEPERVIAAFLKTGMRPVRGNGNPPECGCALQALSHAGMWSTFDTSYGVGFVTGWDKYPPGRPIEGEYGDGYVDGHACAVAVEAELGWIESP